MMMGDSELMVKHIRKRYNIRERILKSYGRGVLDIIKGLNYLNINSFPKIRIKMLTI